MEHLFDKYEGELLQDRFYAWVQDKLQIPDGDINYNSAMSFLASYTALVAFVINATGNAAQWGGPITDTRKYPVDHCVQIWDKVLRAGKDNAVRHVLRRICPDDDPTHPFRASKPDGTRSIIDTLGGIVDMTRLDNGNFTRQLLIATRNTEYMGHIFVSYTNDDQTSVRGLMPYGIQRSAFYLRAPAGHPHKPAASWTQSLIRSTVLLKQMAPHTSSRGLCQR